MQSSMDVWERYDSVNGLNVTIEPTTLIMFVIASIIILTIVILTILRSKRKITPEERLETADTIDEMPIDTFLDITDEQYLSANDIGCYILYNTDKQKYYVGKSPLCADAVNREIIGKGSPDIFYENKDGDSFTVQFFFVSGRYYTNVESLYDDIIEVYGENSEVVGL